MSAVCDCSWRGNGAECKRDSLQLLLAVKGSPEDAKQINPIPNQRHHGRADSQSICMEPKRILSARCACCTLKYPPCHHNTTRPQLLLLVSFADFFIHHRLVTIFPKCRYFARDSMMTPAIISFTCASAKNRRFCRWRQRGGDDANSIHRLANGRQSP